MRISLATNFDDALPTRVRPFGVFELYGRLSADVVGGGRASFRLASVGRRTVARHVAACRKAGLAFNYLLNASCLDNVEYTRAGQKRIRRLRIRRLLDWLSEIGVSSVTVANPFLLRLIKTVYPHFEVRVSASANDIRQVRYWQEIGADRITLDSTQVNREFELLRRIREGIRCRLELLASRSCVQNCPLQRYHPNRLSHASQRGHRGFAIDWCQLWCSHMKLRDPVNYLRADWIRPEDVVHYEALGYDEFKLTERNAPTDILLLRAQAYHERRYDGNLLDLVQPYEWPPAASRAERRGLRWVLRHFVRLGAVRWRKLPLLYALARRCGLLGRSDGTPVYIDNRALDGFIRRFLTQGCRDVDCEACRYCHGWLPRAVRIDEAWRAGCLALYEADFQEIESGSLWIG